MNILICKVATKNMCCSIPLKLKGLNTDIITVFNINTVKIKLYRKNNILFI